MWIRKTEEIHWWKITKSGQEVLDESNEITNEFIRRVFEKTDKEEMARLVSYIHQQYDLAKEELEKSGRARRKQLISIPVQIIVRMSALQTAEFGNA